MNDDADALDGVDRGETATVSKEIELSAWDLVPDEAVGDGRRVRDLDARNIRVANERGNERIVFDVDCDVQRIDPRTVPVFQNEARYDRLQRLDDSERGPKPTPNWKQHIPTAVTAAVLVAVGVIADHVLGTVSGVMINGEQVGQPSPLLIPVVLLAIFTAYLAMAYLGPIALQVGGVGR